MTSAVQTRNNRHELSATTKRRPRRVERWRWLVALATAGAATAAGVGYLVGVWVALILIIGAHEAGHAVAARGLGIPTSAMVIGVGPRVARFVVRGLPIEIRSFPLVGWVAMDRERIPLGSPRVAAVYAAGPAASLLLSVVVLLGAFAWYQGPSNLDVADARYSAQATAEVAQGMWAAPFNPVLDLFRSPTREPGAAAAGAAAEPSEAAAAGESDAEVSSIIGVAVATTHNVETHGAGWILLAVASLSASIAGINLLPAWGLDGHCILEEAAWMISRRNPQWGRRAHGAVTTAGVVTAFLALWLFVTAVTSDLSALL